ncbi:unnamed protein product [Didymodactylos carnosus]|uniref:Uncharacterized protein n=1 Tax=Didymodactylos carnosus TaxID=1234261 RepID=A0A814YVA8_9BILA|nr:unnamed protein product [Didymodactylos carnosus]CAF1235189.1 unnamed protein product [Didymodactylos carnosus]CAF3648002.1 unnamed protein product [Didymodactylos carnosus]CAF3997619.1 unnamed protein product [Didymodactylos carnosus]
MTVALCFVAGAIETVEMKPILFEITADSSLKTVIFADIDKYSRMKGEQEVLFSLGAVFKIDSFEFDSLVQLCKSRMTATDEGSHDVEGYLKVQQREMDEISSTILFGRILMNDMDQTKKAEKYFFKLLQTLPNEKYSNSQCFGSPAVLKM